MPEAVNRDEPPPQDQAPAGLRPRPVGSATTRMALRSTGAVRVGEVPLQAGVQAGPVVLDGRQDQPPPSVMVRTACGPAGRGVDGRAGA